MALRIARSLLALGSVLGAGWVAAQSAAPLPPQNYGAQPGFFRSAPEMSALVSANQGIPAPAPAQPAPPQATPSLPGSGSQPTARALAYRSTAQGCR